MGVFQRLFPCLRQASVVQEAQPDSKAAQGQTPATVFSLEAYSSLNSSSAAVQRSDDHKSPPPQQSSGGLYLTVAAQLTEFPQLGYPDEKEYPERPATPSGASSGLSSSSSLAASPANSKQSSATRTGCLEAGLQCQAAPASISLTFLALLGFLLCASGVTACCAAIAMLTMFIIATTTTKVQQRHALERFSSFNILCSLVELASVLDNMAVWGGSVVQLLLCYSLQLHTWVVAEAREAIIRAGFIIFCFTHLITLAESTGNGVQHLLRLGCYAVSWGVSKGVHSASEALASVDVVSCGHNILLFLIVVATICALKAAHQLVQELRQTKDRVQCLEDVMQGLLLQRQVQQVPQDSVAAQLGGQLHVSADQGVPTGYSQSTLRTNALAMRASEDGYAFASDLTADPIALKQQSQLSSRQPTAQVDQDNITVPEVTTAAPVLTKQVKLLHPAVQHFLDGTKKCIKQYSDDSDGISLHTSQLASEGFEDQATRIRQARCGHDNHSGWSFTRAGFSPAVRLLADSDAGYLGRGRNGQVLYGELEAETYEGPVACAIKCLPYSTPEERLEAESELQALLELSDCDQIVQCQALFQGNTPAGKACLYLANEYCEGVDWDLVLPYIAHEAQRRGIADAASLLGAARKAMMQKLLQAVAAMHAQGRGHFDLKPANVRVDVDEDLIVADLILIDLGSSNTITGFLPSGFVMPGVTLAYSCPEIVRVCCTCNEVPEVVGACAQDVWAVGCMMAELYGGYNPFKSAANSLCAAQEVHEEWAAVYSGQQAAIGQLDLVGALQHSLLDDDTCQAVIQTVMPMLHPNLAARANVEDILLSPLLQ